MHEPPPTGGEAPAARPIELDILNALAPWDERQRPLLSVAELSVELDEPDVRAPLDALRAVGLVHQAPDGRVFASPAAVYLVELVGPIA
jgi:hypothetical protein